MGRKLRRVPVDFTWPIQKVWSGYLNPHFQPCPLADEGLCVRGLTAAQQWLSAVAGLLAMMGDEAVEASPEWRERHARTRRTYPHPYLQGWAHAPRTGLPFAVGSAVHALEDAGERRRAFDAAYERYPRRVLPLTEEVADVVRRLAGTQEDGVFGDHFMATKVERALRRAARLPRTWGTCPACAGEGIHPDARATYEAWRPTDPPTGEGWQVWETVSEGSPISPVFRTKEGVAAWLVVHEPCSRAAAERFVDDGWAPSAVVVDGVATTGVEALEALAESEGRDLGSVTEEALGGGGDEDDSSVDEELKECGACGNERLQEDVDACSACGFSWVEVAQAVAVVAAVGRALGVDASVAGIGEERFRAAVDAVLGEVVDPVNHELHPDGAR